ncbi:excinuclease ABC subunit C [Candidatus Gracilibacteria bacterium]|nr:excinuclease ABC subunit C [Candidatus Gracilibacteria bacterium]
MKSTISEHLEKILQNLPKIPGVYQMKDTKGGVMYVGKAKSLKSRVGSYFVKTNDLSVAKRQMVAKIADIEIITCQTEVEALVLETNIIKHLTPKYNILMKDDKNLAYLKITNSPVPELIKTRQKIRDGGIYFGPYVSAVEQSVRALRRIFRIRNCRVKFAKRNDNIQVTDKAGRTLPCIDYYIGLCPAPCMLHSSKIDEHSSNIARVQAFLSGESSTVFADLEANMRSRAENQEFEEAQSIKETITALRGLHERQKVRDIVDGDIDVCIQYEKYDKTYIALTQVRGAQIIGVFRHEVASSIDEGEDIMIAFLMRQYVSIDEADTPDFPDILLCPKDFVDTAFVEFLKGQKIQLEIPKIGPKKNLLDFTRDQLREYAYKRELATLENKSLTRAHMVNVLERLSYPVPAKGEIVFECYDISHTDGHFTYASRVAIVNGKPDPSRYRKYKIKTLDDGMIDDYASHREVMMRRTIEGIEQDNLPHLIIIDGGKGQLSSAVSGIKEGIWKSKNEPIDPSSQTEHSIPSGSVSIQVSENIEHGFLHPKDTSFGAPTQEGQIPIPPICSIAKREEEIFIPSSSVPILFEHGTPELMVLQKARDESHRFSITANRSARTKAMKKNILEELPGIGPVTRRKLLKLAGSVNGIKDISSAEISKICNIAQVETLRDHGII